MAFDVLWRTIKFGPSRPQYHPGSKSLGFAVRELWKQRTQILKKPAMKQARNMQKQQPRLKSSRPQQKTVLRQAKGRGGGLQRCDSWRKILNV